jgi:hypothetical protein
LIIEGRTIASRSPPMAYSSPPVARSHPLEMALFNHSPVIPAKAGIHSRGAETMDSGFRRNDAEGHANCQRIRYVPQRFCWGDERRDCG